MSITPSAGRIVLVAGEPARCKGATVAPALITRVWGPIEDQFGGWTVNLHVFPDAADSRPATSVRLFDDETQARAWADTSPVPGSSTVAWWPPRV